MITRVILLFMLAGSLLCARPARACGGIPVAAVVLVVAVPAVVLLPADVYLGINAIHRLSRGQKLTTGEALLQLALTVPQGVGMALIGWAVGQLQGAELLAGISFGLAAYFTALAAHAVWSLASGGDSTDPPALTTPHVVVTPFLFPTANGARAGLSLGVAF